MKTRLVNSRISLLARYLAGVALACTAQLDFAADTSLGNVPLFTSSATNVKPNLMFILDDSGSMASDYIPDDVNNFAAGSYGKLTSQCNGVAYNPAVTYALPVNSLGVTASPASLDFLSTDPNVVLKASATNVTSPNTQTLAVNANDTISLTFKGLPKNALQKYTVGDVVTLYSSASSTAAIVGTVSAWTFTQSGKTYSGVLSISVSSVTGTGTLASTLKVSLGQVALNVFYYKYKGTLKPLSYTYTSAGVIKTTNFYLECNSLVGSTPGSAVFDKVNLTSTSAEAQNYANWFTYYKTRILMAKSSIGIVFQGLDSRYRIGYSTISEDTANEGTDFVNIRDFDATQKAKFFAALNAASPGSSTPLRGALSKAGQYYANKVAGQSVDPMQYSCQRNFTLLSTDGYWNTNNETATYGPFGLDGKNVGQTDGFPTVRPKYDGGNVQAIKTMTWKKSQTSITRTVTTSKAYSNITQTTTGVYTAATGSNAGSKVTTYSAPTALTNTYTGYNCTKSTSTSNGSKNSSCVITVTTNSAHGMVTGNRVLISGANHSDSTLKALLNASFSITLVDSTRFTINVTGIPNALVTGLINNSTGNTLSPLPSAAGTSLLQNSSSPVLACTGTNYVIPGTIQQTDNYTLQLRSTVTADVSTTETYTNTQSVLGTYTYTQTQPIFNGVAGALSAITQTGPVNVGTALTNDQAVTTINTAQVVSTPPATTGPALAVVTNSTTAVCGNSVPSQQTSGISSSSYKPPNPPSYVPTSGAGTATAPADTVANNVVVGTPTALTDVPNSLVTTTSNPTYTGGSTDSLADVSYYYFNNDLRDAALWNNCTGALGTDVCGTADKFSKQYMTTLTLGLGVSGLLAYDKNYIAQKNAGSGDFFAIKNGDKDWPVPANGKGPENIDDLWHAAINATDFGTAAIPVTNPSTQYFSAGNPAVLVESLTNALANVRAVVGSSSAAATSTLQPVSGDNDVYVAKFTSVKWIGDLQRFAIDPDLGTISTSASWSAAAQLDARDLTANPRTVYYAKSGQSALQPFTYTNLTNDGMNGLFDGFCNKAGSGGNAAPSQCGLKAGTDLADANTGSKLVAYLLGGNDNNYRARDSRMGDVINGAPLFVGPPKFKYADAGYSTFASATRQGKCASGTVAGSSVVQGTIYVGANDGMLHAFDRCDGSEKWAYVPKTVMPNMYKIADNAYGNNHLYFVDGAPVSGDIYVNGAWKTILVGGLNGGGRGYYALDVTDPANPKALWEFTNNQNANQGLSYGNPVITKRSDGTWVVVFASGYNNNTTNASGAQGDGNGHLIMVNANTGAQLLDIGTMSGSSKIGSTTTPSGLSKINSWVESETDNTAMRYYAGDLLGNVWRFDTENLVAPNQAALLLGKVSDGTNAQPITTQPELAQVTYLGTPYSVVYVGTGQYLGQADLATTGKQTIYAFKDVLGATSLGDLRSSSTLVAQTLTTSGRLRTTTTNTVDWATKNGWYVDLPTTGERVNVPMVLTLNVLSVASTVPSASACESGGTSWQYKLDFSTGSAAPNATDNAAGLLLQEGTLVVGQTVVQLTDGSVTTISTLSTGDVTSSNEAPPISSQALRRTSWRELAN
jgi:type IV pilus assembly protein PilY1